MKFLLFVLLVAALTYLVTRTLLERMGTRTHHAPQELPRMIAPDDADEFLRELDRKRRRGQSDPPPA